MSKRKLIASILLTVGLLIIAFTAIQVFGLRVYKAPVVTDYPIVSPLPASNSAVLSATPSSVITATPTAVKK